VLKDALAISISKTALSALTLEMHKSELILQSERTADASDQGREIKFWLVNPGHCKTAFNGFVGQEILPRE
jgi:hypothetical protein